MRKLCECLVSERCRSRVAQTQGRQAMFHLCQEIKSSQGASTFNSCLWSECLVIKRLQVSDPKASGLTCYAEARANDYKATTAVRPAQTHQHIGSSSVSSTSSIPKARDTSLVDMKKETLPPCGHCILNSKASFLLHYSQA